MGDPHAMATAERRIRSYLDGEAPVELPTPDTFVSPGAGFSAALHGHSTLTACPLCLRVLRGTEWVDAETVIRELRSFEHEAPPRFEPALCPTCAIAIQLRRAEARAPLRRAKRPSSGRR
jgi:hypothetical protein